MPNKKAKQRKQERRSKNEFLKKYGRTAKQLANNDGSSSPKSGNEIITLSPERRMSPYEPFVTHHA